jgi:NADH-quinone oxidoreductase subunit N
MAYSAIGNIGYALVGLAAGSRQGVVGVLVYMAIYLFMTIGTFACILGMRRKGRMVEGIADLAGLSRTHPMMAAAFAVIMFSMAGIPPLAGFFAKFYIFMAAIDARLFGLREVKIPPISPPSDR